MFREIPISSIAACFGMAAFAIAIISGLGAGQPADAILWRAILCAAICYPVGIIVALVGSAAVNEEFRAHQERHPVPDLDAPLSTDLDGAPSA